MPDVEEEDEPPKMHTASKNKKRKEIGGQNNDKVGLGYLTSPHIWTPSKHKSVRINVCIEILQQPIKILRKGMKCFHCALRPSSIIVLVLSGYTQSVAPALPDSLWG